jgi:hypothetical protein
MFVLYLVIILFIKKLFYNLEGYTTQNAYDGHVKTNINNFAKVDPLIFIDANTLDYWESDLEDVIVDVNKKNNVPYVKKLVDNSKPQTSHGSIVSHSKLLSRFYNVPI